MRIFQNGKCQIQQTARLSCIFHEIRLYVKWFTKFVRCYCQFKLVVSPGKQKEHYKPDSSFRQQMIQTHVEKILYVISTFWYLQSLTHVHTWALWHMPELFTKYLSTDRTLCLAFKAVEALQSAVRQKLVSEYGPTYNS